MDLQELVSHILPIISQRLLKQPVVWGDPNRIDNQNTVELCNTLFNTRSGNITIEKDVLFGHNVSILTGTHDIKKRGMDRVKSVPDTGRDIYIEEGVWLASGVTVIGPCRIGRHSVVCANALVNCDLPAEGIYAGTPAKLVHRIDFEE